MRERCLQSRRFDTCTLATVEAVCCYILTQFLERQCEISSSAVRLLRDIGFISRSTFHGLNFWYARVMRQRTSYIWALAAGFALSILLVFTYHFRSPTINPSTRMSAPSDNAVMVELASATKLGRSQCDWSRPTPQLASFWLVWLTVHAMGGGRENESVTPPPYWPLYRRPPPISS